MTVELIEIVNRLKETFSEFPLETEVENKTVNTTVFGAILSVIKSQLISIDACSKSLPEKILNKDFGLWTFQNILALARAFIRDFEKAIERAPTQWYDDIDIGNFRIVISWILLWSEYASLKIKVHEQPSVSAPAPITDAELSPENSDLENEVEKFKEALATLEERYSLGRISKESYSMAKASLERKLQSLLKQSEEFQTVRKYILSEIESKGSVSKADIVKGSASRIDLVNQVLKQLEDEGIIEKTASGERYKFKATTKPCPYCKRNIPVDLPVCPMCGALIE